MYIPTQALTKLYTPTIQRTSVRIVYVHTRTHTQNTLTYKFIYTTNLCSIMIWYMQNLQRYIFAMRFMIIKMGIKIARLLRWELLLHDY